MLDFSSLVLGPAMAVFGEPIVVMPFVSQPGVGPYPAVGIYKADTTSVQMEDGAILASTIYSLGIQLSGFLVPPVAEDQIMVSGSNWWVDRVHPDGQGGAIMTLKRTPTPPPTPW